MAENGGTDRQVRRSRRSTRIGIIVLIALAVLVAAIVWGIQNWSEDDDQEGPSVGNPAELVLASWDYRAA